MKVGRGSWIALAVVALGAILWTEAVMAAIRTGSEPLMKAAGIGPVALVLILFFVWAARRPRPEIKPEEKVRVSLRYKSAGVYYDRGTLRRDGGLLVFESPGMRFAIGHDAIAEQPKALIGDYGASLVAAPKGTRLALRGDPKTVLEWANADSEPTQTPVPLLVMPEPGGPPSGWVGNLALFTLGCLVAGAVVGGYLDYRGYVPSGRSALVALMGGLGGFAALLWGAALSSLHTGRKERATVRALEFREIEPWRPANS